MTARLVRRTVTHRADVTFDAEAVLGRAPNCNVHLDTDEVSTRHARVYYDDKQKTYMLEDLGSANGTRLDGMLIARAEALGPVNVITLARTVDVIFVDLGAAEAGAGEKDAGAAEGVKPASKPAPKAAKAEGKTAAAAAKPAAEPTVKAPAQAPSTPAKEAPAPPAAPATKTPPEAKPAAATEPENVVPQPPSIPLDVASESPTAKQGDATEADVAVVPPPPIPSDLASGPAKAKQGDATEADVAVEPPPPIPSDLASGPAKAKQGDATEPTAAAPPPPGGTATRQDQELVGLPTALRGSGDSESPADVSVTRAETRAIEVPKPAVMTLVIDASGTRHPVPEGETVLGRDPDCGIRLVAFDVSRRHAALTLSGGQVTLRDLGSRYGTFINDDQVKEETTLSPGTPFRIGSVRCRLEPTKD